jgi:hypothetical protein
MRDNEFFKETPRKTYEIQGRKVEFPVFYYDFSAVTASFIVKASKLREMLPHPKFIPAEIWPGTGVLTISAYEYRDTDIGPYNEVAVSVPINFETADFLPPKSAISMLRRHKFTLYVHQLPVTTEEARLGGVYFYNYPKFLADITIENKGERIVTTLKEKDDLILKMSAKKLPLKKPGAVEYHTFSIKDNQILHTLIEGKAERIGYSMMGKFAEIELGDHAVAEELKELNLGQNSHSGQYAEGVMSKLHHPDKSWNVETLEQISEA